MPVLVADLIRFGIPLALVVAGIALIRDGVVPRSLGVAVLVVGGVAFLLLLAMTIRFLRSFDSS